MTTGESFSGHPERLPSFIESLYTPELGSADIRVRTRTSSRLGIEMQLAGLCKTFPFRVVEYHLLWTDKNGTPCAWEDAGNTNPVHWHRLTPERTTEIPILGDLQRKRVYLPRPRELCSVDENLQILHTTQEITNRQASILESVVRSTLFGEEAII